MRKLLFLVVMFSLLAATPAIAAPASKVGLFQARAVAEQCAPYREAQKRIEGQFAGEKAALEKLNGDLQKQAESMRSQGAAMSPESRDDKAAELMRKRRDLEDRVQEYTRKVENALGNIQREFFSNLAKAAQDYGNRSGYDILLDANSGGIVFFDKSVDVTADMIAEVTRVYKETRSAPKR